MLLNREEVGEYNLVVTATDLDPSEVDRKEMPVPVIIIGKTEGQLEGLR